MTRPTSAAVFQQIRDEGLLVGMRFAVYAKLVDLGLAMTAAEIAAETGLERRDVSSRCSELVRQGVAREAGVGVCPVSGRKVLRFVSTNALPQKLGNPAPWDAIRDRLREYAPSAADVEKVLGALRTAGISPSKASAFLSELRAAELVIGTPAKGRPGEVQTELFDL